MANKTKITYKLSAFDHKRASSGELCVMIKDKDYSGSLYPTTIANITYDDGQTSGHTEGWYDTEDFGGAGVCKFKEPNNYIFVVDSIIYIFDSWGRATTMQAKGWKLVMGEITEDVTAVGDAVTISTKTIIKRTINPNSVPAINNAPPANAFNGEDTPGEDNIEGDSGGGNSNNNSSSQIIPDPDYDPASGRIITDRTEVSDTITIVDVPEGGNTVVVDDLNARDQFAVKALGELLARIPDPSTLSDNERSHYCNTAYEWAANMMTSAAKARATVNYVTGEGESETPVDAIVSSNNNTERLLGGIIEALEKTDIATNTGTSENPNYIYSERVSIPDLKAWLDNYVAHTPTGSEPASKTTVGLDDLITAIKGISSGGGGGGSSSSTDVSGIVSALMTTGDANTVSGAVASLKSALMTSGQSTVSGALKNSLDSTVSGAIANLSTNVTAVKNALMNSNAGDGTVSGALYGIAYDGNGNQMSQLLSDNLTGNINHLKVDCTYTFPSKSMASTAFTDQTLDAFLTFNSSGDVGNSSKVNVTKAIASTLITNDCSTQLNALTSAIYANASNASANDVAHLFEAMKIYIDSRIRAWIVNSGTKVTINGTDYSITAPASI